MMYAEGQAGADAMAGMVHRAPVKSEAASAAMRRLQAFVSRMERRYECSSEEMIREVRERPLRETREVGKWLAEYRLLIRLQELEAVGRAAGSASTSIS
jgi:hypothetical protein